MSFGLTDPCYSGQDTRYPYCVESINLTYPQVTQKRASGQRSLRTSSVVKTEDLTKRCVVRL